MASAPGPRRSTWRCSQPASHPALHLALLAAGIAPGDEVITVAHTFVATVAAIRHAGARPVLVDVDPQRLTLDPERLEAAITDRTRAILPVHLYGQPADMDPILDVAARRDLVVIEDASQAHGAELGRRRVGGIGRLGCFSFYPAKNLGAAGEAGAVTTDDAGLAHRLRMLRDWGCEQKHHHVLEGYNYRMDGIQGAVLGVKLRHLEAWTDTRIARAARYGELLRDCDVALPEPVGDVRHVYHVFAVRVARRDAVLQTLQAAGIEAAVHYPIPVHLQQCYAPLGYRRGDFPESERAADEVLSLPIYPELTEAQQETVAGALREALQSSSAA